MNEYGTNEYGIMDEDRYDAGPIDTMNVQVHWMFDEGLIDMRVSFWGLVYRGYELNDTWPNIAKIVIRDDA